MGDDTLYGGTGPDTCCRRGEYGHVRKLGRGFHPALRRRDRHSKSKRHERLGAHRAAGWDVAAVYEATGIARSTIGRGLSDLRNADGPLIGRIRRPGGVRKPKTETEPGLVEALGDLVQSAIRGDPEAALLWVSKSQRHLVRALADRGYTASQKLVGRLLRDLGFSLQANKKTLEGATHPDRDARAVQFSDL